MAVQLMIDKPEQTAFKNFEFCEKLQFLKYSAANRYNYNYRNWSITLSDQHNG